MDRLPHTRRVRRDPRPRRRRRPGRPGGRGQHCGAVAALYGVRELVLGAWGCGVFRNDPDVVAEAFEQALSCHGAAFGKVVFAIWDRSPESVNRAAFRARFGAGEG
ncbi:TIGR02452 family protein [Kitasatospora sp. GAS204A]|uniref:TIGR02452 family protein n=1 Tax=Kitasatospora sp. GAS204A TaxID=3349328 RepID=UPI00384D4676